MINRTSINSGNLIIFNIFIGYSMQLKETPTLPINVTINDLSVSKTVKEVLKDKEFFS